MLKRGLLGPGHVFGSEGSSALGGTFLNWALVLLSLLAAVSAAIAIVAQQNGYKAILMLLAFAIVGLRWRLFGVVFLMIVLSPFGWVPFNLDRIPVIGWVLNNTPHEDKLIILCGGVYLLLDWIAGVKTKERVRIVPSAFLVGTLGFGFLVAMVFAWQAGTDSIAMQWYLSTLVLGSIIYCLVRSVVKNRSQLRAIVYAMILASVLFGLVTQLFRSALGVEFVPDTDPGRFGGFFTLPLGITTWANPVYISSYMALTIVLAWGFLLAAPTMWRQIFWLGVFAILTSVLVQTNSRTGIYGALAGVVMVSALLSLAWRNESRSKSRSARQWLSYGVLVPAGAAIVFGQFSSYFSVTQNATFYVNRVLRPLEDANTIGRVRLFQASFDANLAYPWGIGAQAVHVITGYNEHSLYTLMLSGLGWGGLALFICFVAWCALQCTSGMRSKEKEGRLLASLVLGGIITIAIMGFGHPFLGTLWGVTLFWSLLAVASLVPRI